MDEAMPLSCGPDDLPVEKLFFAMPLHAVVVAAELMAGAILTTPTNHLGADIFVHFPVWVIHVAFLIAGCRLGGIVAATCASLYAHNVCMYVS